jgi:uncharacterized membrane protein YfcA
VSLFELVLVAVWAFTVSFFGGMVGMVLGNLRLPLIVLVGSSAAAAAGANVAISGAAALTAAYAHWQGGRLSWRLFAWMAPTSLVGAIAGGLISGVLPNRVLLGAIAVVVLYGAVEIARYRRPAGADEVSVPDRRRLLVNAALVGFGVGVLGGLVGLILGTLRLPALIKYAGVSPYAAVGTNAAVGVGIGGLVGHLPGGIDWSILAVGAAAAMPAAYLGARLTGRLDEHQLLRAISAILVVSGSAMAVQAIVG